jgi:DNA repair photolyase
MHEVTAKGILSNKNNMNIYRGCTHGCIYCDSRSECYGMPHAFDDIEVKANAVELLDQTLSKRRKKAVITTGAMTDPYMPLEKELLRMRHALEVIERHGFGVSVLTKSDLVLRDIDILQRINKKAKCVVQMTLTTYDEELCRKIEPNVAATHRRFEVLKEMQRVGIPTVVWMTPLLPFINDTEENIRGILSYCADAKVHGLITFGVGMTLRNGNREYFYKKLDEHFPGLKSKYMQAFGTSYVINSPHSERLNRIIKEFCKENSIINGMEEVFEYIADFGREDGQISLWQ